MLRHHTLLYKNSAISYYKSGSGVKKLLCIHGYGESAENFLLLCGHLANEYEITILELPYHGKTLWEEGDLLPENLAEIINEIIPDSNTKITVCGYSLGGRIALNIIPYLKERIDKMVLLASDGLHKNFWYQLATQTSIGNKLFAFTMKKPKWFFKLMGGMVKLKILNKSIYKFSMHYLGDENERTLLYKRWTTFKRFNADKKLLLSFIKKYKIQVHFYFGKYDRIIKPNHAEALQKVAHEQITVSVLNTGHILLKEKNIVEIKKGFLVT